MENRSSFGRHPDLYRRYRPQYPRELFEYLAGLCEQHEAALDCATGNGQAAVGLADYFARVDAFDNSPDQIGAAIDHPKVKYRVASAERLPYKPQTFDLIAVAQGAHWFDLPKFYQEVARVAKPRAVLAIWGYSFCDISPEIDAIVAAKLLEPIERYWADGNHVIRDRYRSIEFPFEEIEPPPFVMHQQWDRSSFVGYVRTWSAYKRYLAEHEDDPAAAVDRALARVWPADETREAAFELVMRIGRVVT